jgi:hypothetical protein
MALVELTSKSIWGGGVAARRWIDDRGDQVRALLVESRSLFPGPRYIILMYFGIAVLSKLSVPASTHTTGIIQAL